MTHPTRGGAPTPARHTPRPEGASPSEGCACDLSKNEVCAYHAYGENAESAPEASAAKTTTGDDMREAVEKFFDAEFAVENHEEWHDCAGKDCDDRQELANFALGARFVLLDTLKATTQAECDHKFIGDGLHEWCAKCLARYPYQAKTGNPVADFIIERRGTAGSSQEKADEDVLETVYSVLFEARQKFAARMTLSDYALRGIAHDIADALAAPGASDDRKHRSPFHVPPVEVEVERLRGWTGFHPEDYCHRCGNRNLHAWHVDSDLWNRVVREHGWPEILCPQCFAEAYEQATGVQPVWELRIDAADDSGDVAEVGPASPSTLPLSRGSSSNGTVYGDDPRSATTDRPMPHTEGEALSFQCKKGMHDRCPGYVQYRDGKPPRRCICDCHKIADEPGDAPCICIPTSGGVWHRAACPIHGREAMPELHGAAAETGDAPEWWLAEPGRGLCCGHFPDYIDCPCSCHSPTSVTGQLALARYHLSDPEPDLEAARAAVKQAARLAHDDVPADKAWAIVMSEALSCAVESMEILLAHCPVDAPIERENYQFCKETLEEYRDGVPVTGGES